MSDITVGIFANQQEAEQAVNELDALGLDEGSIHVMTREQAESNSNGVLGGIARALSAEGGAVSSSLTSLGLDAEEAEFYERELGETGVIIAVTDDDHADSVMRIMRAANGTVRD